MGITTAQEIDQYQESQHETNELILTAQRP